MLSFVKSPTPGYYIYLKAGNITKELGHTGNLHVVGCEYKVCTGNRAIGDKARACATLLKGAQRPSRSNPGP